MPPSNGFQVFHHLVAGARVQSTRRLIEKKDLGSSDQLACYTKPTFLSATDTLSYWCTDNSVGLILQTESGDQLFHPVPALACCD